MLQVVCTGQRRPVPGEVSGCVGVQGWGGEGVLWGTGGREEQEQVRRQGTARGVQGQQVSYAQM